MKKSAMIFVVALLLSGCDVVNQARLDMAYSSVRENCLNLFAVSCARKTASYNIILIRHTPFLRGEAKEELIYEFGKEGWKLWLEAEKEVKNQAVKFQKQRRPDLFKYLVFGDNILGYGDEVVLLDTDSLISMRNKATNIFMEKITRAGIKPASLKNKDNVG